MASNGRYTASGGEAKILYVYNAIGNTVSRWDTTDDIKAIVFNRNSINQKMFVGGDTGEVMVMSFNCSRQACPSDHFMDTTGCRFCGDVLPKCVNCINQTICDKCLDGYFLNNNDYQCNVC